PGTAPCPCSTFFRSDEISLDGDEHLGLPLTGEFDAEAGPDEEEVLLTDPQPVTEPVIITAVANAAAATTSAADDDDDLIDDEIIEIFLEEAGEVTDKIGRAHV